MKLLCFTDNHFCENYSIVRHFGTKYSSRLENQILSVNWVEEMAIKNKCDAVICLGDFFDKPELNEQEITALKDISWNKLPHYFIVGNHESDESDLQYNSAKVLETPTHNIISSPSEFIINKTKLCFLPYILESDRKGLNEYFNLKECEKNIILSHNDLKGIQMGPVVSKTGFDLDEIDDSCDLFINGHLHNGQKVSKKAMNLGNLTGKDFGEDATRYSHNIMLLDTDTLEYSLIENPFAFNFYKLEINMESDLNKLNSLKNQAVLSIKCVDTLVDEVKNKIQELTAAGIIAESRLIITRISELENSSESDLLDLTTDHLTKFVECCREKINNSSILEEELSKICK